MTDVIEPSGRFLGTVRFPNNRSTIAWSRGDTLWTVEHVVVLARFGDMGPVL